ncbi:MFS transporter, partial [Salmonella enterica subsp. enterica serovar Oslo]
SSAASDVYKRQIIGIIWGHLPDVWRYMLLVQAIPAICLFVGMWRAPESPRWLISKNRHDEALHILKQIRPAERAQKEYDDISTPVSYTHLRAHE